MCAVVVLGSCSEPEQLAVPLRAPALWAVTPASWAVTACNVQACILFVSLLLLLPQDQLQEDDP